VQIVQTLTGIFLIAFILLGNAGLHVFKHSCEEDGTFTSYILPVDDHCQEMETEDLPSCCKKEAMQVSCCAPEKDDDDCCSDEVDIYTVDFDYFQDSDLEIPCFIFEGMEDFFVFLEYPEQTSQSKVYCLRPPPDPPSGREILIQNQVFRI